MRATPPGPRRTPDRGMTHPQERNAETIAAVATPPGRGGVGIIRLSGPSARTIGEQICGRQLQPRHAHFCRFSDSRNEVLDTGIGLLFPGPHSFTGEDVVELQAHGGPVILDLLLRECTRLGARPARPGEFSERAFLNDKLDLAQAEAIADLINSTTEAAARGASRSLQGEFSNKVRDLEARVTRLRVFVEAAIDFPEEEIDFIAEGQVARQLAEIEASLAAVSDQARQGSLLQEGMKLVIAGAPNAGKSSLLNALSGRESAIVTPIEGTTRDVLREHIQLEGMPLHIVDTAGLRDSTDAVEIEGIRRARAEMHTADQVLLVIDNKLADAAPGDPDSLWPPGSEAVSPEIPITVILNKCDLSRREPALAQHCGHPAIHLSATTGAGVQLLREHLKTCMGFAADTEGNFSARRRHLAALEKAADYLRAGRAQLSGAGAGELLAEDLRLCHQSLGEIVGEVTSDRLLGEIFSSFCIGK